MKKGVMFSVIVFFLAVTLVGLIVIQRSLVSYRREQMYIETRINAINSHYDSVIRDLGKTIEGSTQRAIVACVNYVLDNGPLSEANVTIQELILKGTLNGEKNFMMENSTIPFWVGQIEGVSTLRGFEVDIDTGIINDSLVVKPYSSFYLIVEADLKINIIDIQGVSALNRTTRLKKTVSIEGMEDPLYLSFFNGLSSNYVWESPYVLNHTQLIFTGSSDENNGDVYGIVTNDTSDFTGKILVVDNYIPAYNGARGIIAENYIDPTTITSPYVYKAGALDLVSNGTTVLLEGDSVNPRVWYIENLQKHIAGKEMEETHHSYYQASDDGPSYLDRLEGKYEIQQKYNDTSDNIIGIKGIGPKKASKLIYNKKFLLDCSELDKYKDKIEFNEKLTRLNFDCDLVELKPKAEHTIESLLDKYKLKSIKEKIEEYKLMGKQNDSV